MSVIPCPSCGMQFNGQGMQPGVQFKCTGCGSMVQVPGGATAPAAPRKMAGGGKGPGGRAPAGRGAGGGQPMPGGARQQGGNQQDKPRFGPPAKKGSSAVVGIAIGVIALVLIIVVVVVASGPSPAEEQKAIRDAEREVSNDQKTSENATIAEQNARIKKAEDASKALGQEIVAAINGTERAELAGMFDWGEVSTYLQKITKGAMPSPMFYNGEWELLTDDGGGKADKWNGTSIRSSSDLELQIMNWIEQTGFGAVASMDMKKTEDDKSKLGWKLNGKQATGYKLAIKVGKRKYEYWAVCEVGTEDARIVFFNDEGHVKKMKDARKAERKKSSGGGQDLSRRDPEPGREQDPEPGREDEPEEIVKELPEAKATGVFPEHPDLVNMVKYVCVRDKTISDPYKKKIQGKSAADKKRALGAFIDYLLTAHKENDRRDMINISSAMYEIWGGIVYTEWKPKDMIFIMTQGEAVGGIDVIRRWIDIYNNSYNDK